MLTFLQVAHTDTAVERFELSGLDIDADVIRDSLSRVCACHQYAPFRLLTPTGGLNFRDRQGRVSPSGFT